MTIGRVPAADVEIDESLVRSLLRAQHPDLAELPLTHGGSGWDNQLYRLGDDLAVRLPRRRASAELVVHEQRWLPQLAPRLPVRIPVPVRVGAPGCGYPWAWSIVPWLHGRDAATTAFDARAMAGSLGDFVRALHRPAPAEAPRNPFRGVPLRERADAVHDRLAQVTHVVDTGALLARWMRAVDSPPWNGSPVWLHGDLHPANLLVENSRLTGIVDFGDLTAGDPATDLAVAWMALPAEERDVFRAAARESADRIDAATWRRASGWAIVLGLAFAANSGDSDKLLAIGLRTIAAVLADQDLDEPHVRGR